MSKGSDFKPNPPETKNGQSTPHLTLVVCNPPPVQKEPAPLEPSHPTVGFFAEVYSKGPDVYEMKAQDPSHYLECDLTLEVMEGCNDDEGGIICHFDAIVDKQFYEFVEGDETLYGILMVQFHMQIMEELLLFCAEHDASGLIIYADDAQAEQLGIYDSILVHQDQTLTELGEKTVMVIPTHWEIFDQWVDFMQGANQRLQQALWLEQRSNPTIRHYLKCRSLG